MPTKLTTLNILKINNIYFKEGDNWTQINIPECSTRQKNRLKSRRIRENDWTESEESCSDYSYQSPIQAKAPPPPMPVVRLQCDPNQLQIPITEEKSEESIFDISDSSFFESMDNSFFDIDEEFESFGFFMN